MIPLSTSLHRVFDSAAPASHPLDPLLPYELNRSVEIVRESGGIDGNSIFPLVMLDEPSRVELRDYTSNQVRVDRRVRVTSMDVQTGLSTEHLVSLTLDRLLASTPLIHDGLRLQPPIVLDEYRVMEEVVKSDPRWLAAIRRRGITDIDLVQVDPLSAGAFASAKEHNIRVIRAVSYLESKVDDNAYAHPIDGLVAYVDLTGRCVIDVIDDGLMALPAEDSNFHDSNGVPPRLDLKPLEISQPDGPSFTVDGWVVNWQKWSFRVSMNAKEGMVLHSITYDDEGKIRPILNRASFVEMVVPYGDPRPAQYWRSAFDAGEYGLGAMATPLTLGCDCLGSIYYFDSYFAGADGVAYTTEKAICLHEEDYGVLWRGANWRRGGQWVRRSRRFVISFWATLGNYDYGFFWYFYQDGTIQCEAKLTGIIQTATLPAGESSPYISRVGPNVGGQNHQHLFCVRLDPTVDGPLNSVYEVEAEPVPMGEVNPHGNAFRKVSTLITSESMGRREASAQTSRTWLIANDSCSSDVADKVGYKLVSAHGALMMADTNSTLAQRALFAKSPVWVTAYEAGERYPAGEYPNQSAGGDGLPRWMKADRNLVNDEIVIWHSFGTTHFTRPEDWPVMPVEYAGFMLKPSGFFQHNPALDVPAPGVCGS